MVVSLIDELEAIMVGEVKSIIEQGRELLANGDIQGYKDSKGRLPAVTFSGIFNGGHKYDNLSTYNPIMTLDIDGLKNEELEEVRQRLLGDEYLHALWLSPSGLGLKGLIRIESTFDLHKLYFREMVGYFKDKYDANLDRSGSDITRLCFTSYDPNLYYNEGSKIFTLSQEYISSSISISKAPRKARKVGTNLKKQIKLTPVTFGKYEKHLLFDTTGKNRVNTRLQMFRIITFLSKRGLSLTPSYTDWVRVSFGIANSFSHDVGEKYFMKLCRLDGSKHNEYKSKELLKYAYIHKREEAVNFGSIMYMAEQLGFEQR